MPVAPLIGSPLSSWQPPAPPDVAVAAYVAEDIDPATGEVMSLTSGIDPTDASLITQARTVRASGAAVLEDGHQLDEIENNDDDAPARVTFELKRLLAPFVARREIVVLQLDVEAGPQDGDTGAAQIVYRNVRTSAERPLAVG